MPEGSLGLAAEVLLEEDASSLIDLTLPPVWEDPTVELAEVDPELKFTGIRGWETF